MGQYSDDPAWEDVVPLPQDDGGPNPLAAIAYTDEYSEAMSYLRAIMARNEMSERALRLTEDIIDMNAAHYTVWCVALSLPSPTTSSALSSETPLLTDDTAGCTARRFSKPPTQTCTKNYFGSTRRPSRTRRTTRSGTTANSSSTAWVPPTARRTLLRKCLSTTAKTTTSGATDSGW